MTDAQLINYCDSHSETPRALFSREQVQRMVKLAGWGEIENYVPEWISLKEEMKDLVRDARAKAGETV